MEEQKTEGMSVDQFRYQTLLQEHSGQIAALTERIIALQVENQVLRQRLEMATTATEVSVGTEA